jgi:hypothetical protein
LNKTSQDFSIPVYNDGNKPLALEVLKTTCGCLFVTRYNKIIPSHSVGKLTCQIRGDEPRAGKLTQQILLATNDPDHKEFFLEVRYRTSSPSPIWLAPAAINMQVDKDELDNATGASTQQILLMDAFKNELLLTSITSSPHISVATTEVTHTCPAGITTHGFRLTLRLLPSLSLGAFTEWIRIDTNCDSMPTLTIPVTGTVRSGTTITPRMVTFGLGPISNPGKDDLVVRVNIRNHSGKVHVAKVQSTEPWLRAEVAHDDADAIITMSVAPKALTSDQSPGAVLKGSLRLSLDSPIVEEHVIDVQWVRH